MPRLIKGEAIVEDGWQWIEDKAAKLADLPAGPVMVPLALWQNERDGLLDRNGDLGIWLDSDEEAETIADDLEHFGVIGLHFPAYADGRNLSNAVLLRSRFGYRGEIRALGDVARDQLSYMRRCGFDAFQIPAERDPEQEIAGLKVMRDYYQGDVLEPQPLFRRIARPA
ncbi:MAG: DUF934 domain-containing protein [Gammaproteobacteria bacterium]|nr:DUF934 domain-containing protein [Gammaproteobacteria bacterium]